MKRYFIKRIIEIVPMILLISFLSFLIAYISPGDPINMYITPEMSEQEIEDLKISLGVNGSFLEQYLNWGKKTLQGDWGNSIILHRPVKELILQRIPATVGLMGISFLISILISLVLGVYLGINQNSKADKIIGVINYIGISIPSFWFSIMLIIIFSLKLNLLPSSGISSSSDYGLFSNIKYAILPATVISFGNIAIYTRYIRSSVIEELDENYVLTAKSRGLSKWQVVFKHVLKNCLLPFITIVCMNIPGILSGSFIVETVFAWPGIGTLAMGAINSLDYPLIMGYVLMTGIFVIIGNLLADILYCVVDPRIRYGGEFSE